MFRRLRTALISAALVLPFLVGGAAPAAAAATTALTQVCEIGVDFIPAPGATGQSSVYLDNVTIR
jgi:hypothetical protein